MKQTVFTIVIVLVIVGLIAVVVVMGSRGKKTDTKATQLSIETGSSIAPSPNQAPIFFYGNTCPHCEDVEKWMKENKVEEKIKIIKKEVYDSHVNSLELAKLAESCGLLTDNIGVPFLYTPEGKCLVGAPDIIGYLSDKAGLSNSTKATSLGKEGGQ